MSWHIYDRLVSYTLDEPRDKIQQYRLDKPKGDIAERWDVSEDGRAYTFHLRRGAVFHDGSPVTAEDVRWSLQRTISLPTTKFVLNLGGLASEDQIKVIDETTLTIALPKPNRYLPLSLSTPFAPIINAKLVKPNVTANDPWGGEWLKGNNAGSGAYRVTTFRPDQVVLERNDKWYGSRPALRWAVFQTVPEDTMRVALVERGLADVAIGLTPNAIDGVERRGQAQLLLVPMPNQFEFLVMNVQSKPFDDVRVRQALAHAIPQEEIFRSVFWGGVQGCSAVLRRPAAQLFHSVSGSPTTRSEHAIYRPKRATPMVWNDAFAMHLQGRIFREPRGGAQGLSGACRH